MTEPIFDSERPPRFDRSNQQPVARIGDGEIGGKASGLLSARRVLATGFDRGRFPEVEVDVPRFVVLTTEVFDRFLENEGLTPIPESESDDRIAHRFQRADFPFLFAGDLRAFLDGTDVPLAIRSSSLLEDRLSHPFAGVYATKMLPNEHPDPDVRYQRLIEAIQFVYASMFFRGARAYLRSVSKSPRDEKMAIVLQEVVGRRHQDRFYPSISGVARSYNYYAFGKARPENGVVDLALGLGKTIVDGGVCWSYSPALPRVPPPFASARDQLNGTQTHFWAVNMGRPPIYDPVSEIEFLERHDLAAADYDGVLSSMVSTYDAASDRMLPGLRGDGPRVLNFAPMLEHRTFPLNDLVTSILRSCERTFGAGVEIEFALDLPGPTAPRAHFGFLQVRPMAGVSEHVTLPEGEPDGLRALLRSPRVLGNGVALDLEDVVFVRPDVFELARSREAALEIESFNRRLQEEGRKFVLIGYGRFGTSDPWLGIPVEWSQISEARVIVEASLEGVRVDPSQGSHFFHNLSSFGVSYFTVKEADDAIDWNFLNSLPVLGESSLVRHVRLDHPLKVMVDGRSAEGVIYRSV